MASYQPLQERAYDYLKERILSGEIEEGVFYSEAKVGSEIGVSRTPMRAAILRLVQEGYIENIPNKGFHLKPITIEDIEEVYRVRCAVEGYCGSLLQRNITTAEGKAVLKALEENYSHMEDLEDKYVKDPSDRSLQEAIVKDDLLFHQMIIEFSGSEHLMEIFRTHRQMISRLIRQGNDKMLRAGRILTEHRAIIDALKDPDGRKIYNAVEYHLGSTREVSTEILNKRA